MLKTKGLNIRAMESLIALVDNKFNIGNAAIDLDVKHSEVSGQLLRIERCFDFKIFYREPNLSYYRRAGILGLTTNGAKLHEVCRLFLHSVEEIIEQ